MNPEQRAAVEAKGEVFVSAGAGTGKTSVLVERFVGAVCDEGLDVESVLVITYTRKAAGELRARIRAALHARGRHDLARRLDGAWISTIHGFCSRLLRAHPFAVGIDPRFRELDDEHGAVIRGEAFERALAGFCSTRDSERLRLLATYGAQGLRRMLTGVYETLRSAGRDVRLELGDHGGLPERARGPARGGGDARSPIPRRPTSSSRPRMRRSRSSSNPEQLLDLSHLAASGERAAEFRGARDRLNQAAFDELAARDSELLQELLDLFAAEYAAAKARESSLDFEDLQLYARDLLRDHPEVREAEQLRFRAIMVDEFQDTNRLQCDIVDLLRDGAGAPDVFFVGDEFQSIYGFRHADVAVFRERRERAALRLPLSRNYRSRPEVLAAVNHLFGEEFGDGYQPLAASGEFTDPVFGHPVELLVSDKRSYREAGEGWRDGEARAIARRVRELVDERRGRAGRDRAALRRRHRRRALRGGAPGARPADLSRHRPRLLRPAAGRRPALVSAPAAQPLRRRGARHGARVAVRRRLERRARAHPPPRRQAAALHRNRALAAGAAVGGRPAPRARLQAALRPARRRRRRGCRSSGSARRSSPRTTTTSRCSPSGTAAAATRTSAS